MEVGSRSAACFFYRSLCLEVQVVVDIIVLGRKHDGVIHLVTVATSKVQRTQGACVVLLDVAHNLLHLVLANVGSLEAYWLLHVCR